MKKIEKFAQKQVCKKEMKTKISWKGLLQKRFLTQKYRFEEDEQNGMCVKDEIKGLQLD